MVSRQEALALSTNCFLANSHSAKCATNSSLDHAHICSPADPPWPSPHRKGYIVGAAECDMLTLFLSVIYSEYSIAFTIFITHPFFSCLAPSFHPPPHLSHPPTSSDPPLHFNYRSSFIAHFLFNPLVRSSHTFCVSLFTPLPLLFPIFLHRGFMSQLCSFMERILSLWTSVGEDGLLFLFLFF
jgi:hypothetical protein